MQLQGHPTNTTYSCHGNRSAGESWAGVQQSVRTAQSYCAVYLLPTVCAKACCAACALPHLPLLQATSSRSQLLEYIQQEAGVATLLDVRRTQGYDAAKAVDALLDSPAARQWMRAAPQV